MKKIMTALLACALLIPAGCTSQAPATPNQSPTPVPTIEVNSMSDPATAVAETDLAAEKYLDVLEGIYYDSVLPDGQRLEPYTEYFEESPNEFAIFDIDGDGRDELIIRYINTYTAGMFGVVYGYDSTENRLTTQLLEFPALSFYPNGTVEAGWSHNQGLAGRFWPCTLYQYDSTSDSYFPIAFVDAWDREFFETDFDGNPFPNDADPNGDNIVYYIYLYGQQEEPAPVSQQEFDAWYHEMIGFDPTLHEHSTFALEIPYLPLTEENILSLVKE